MVNQLFSGTRVRRSGFVFCAGVLLVFAHFSIARAGLFGSKEIASTWNASAVVEGTQSAWYEFSLLTKNELSVAVSNDEKNLYVYVAAWDSDAAAQLSGKFGQAFTVWLDGKAGKKKVYGIRLKVKASEENAEVSLSTKAKSEEKKIEGKKEIPYVAVIVDEKGPVSTLKADGVAFRTGFNWGLKPMFEFKFPLEKVLSKSAGFIGIGFETSKIDNSILEEISGPASAGIGTGPETKGHHKSKAVSPEASQPETIGFWLKIKLASKP